MTGEEEVGDKYFVTDSGLVVPRFSLQLRERLQSSVEGHGIGLDRLADNLEQLTSETQPSVSLAEPQAGPASNDKLGFQKRKVRACFLSER